MAATNNVVEPQCKKHGISIVIIAGLKKKGAVLVKHRGHCYTSDGVVGCDPPTDDGKVPEPAHSLAVM
jgi:hypothetical protein